MLNQRRMPSARSSLLKPKPNADKGKGQARDKAKTEEELLLEEEEQLRKRRNKTNSLLLPSTQRHPSESRWCW